MVYPTSFPQQDKIKGYYTPDNYDETTGRWTDSSPNGNDITTSSGTKPTHHTDADNQNLQYVQFTNSPHTHMTFPVGILVNNNTADTFTFFHVTRRGKTPLSSSYDDSGRTFQDQNYNWLSSNWSTKEGVFYYNGWVTETDRGYEKNWHIGVSQQANAWSMGYKDGLPSIQRQPTSGYYKDNVNPNGNLYNNIQINTGAYPNERCDFAVGTILIYKVKLSDSEVEQVMATLEEYYFGNDGISGTGNLTFTGSNINPEFPVDISLGIVSWYDGDSFDTSENKWTDKTGNFDLSSDYITGTIIKKGSNQLTNSVLISNRNNKKYHQNITASYLSGNSNSGISLVKNPSYQFLTDVSYTFFHVARRDPSDVNQTGRVFDGSVVDWYSGFNDASSGVAKHVNYSINTIDRDYGKNWVVSVDRPKYYRSVGYSDTRNGYYEISSGNINDTNTTTPQISIHYGLNTYQSSAQQCNWNVGEIISYNRTLDITEENKIFDYLKHRYLGTNQSTSGEVYQLSGIVTGNNSLIRGFPPEYSSINNIIGWYIPESYDVSSGYWRDVSLYKNDLSSCGTTPQYVVNDSKYKWLSYIKGSSGDTYEDASGYKFPENFLPSDGSYTLIHVSRRVKDSLGNSSGRIFDSVLNKNFYSGFIGTKTGVALHSIDVSASITQGEGEGGGGGQPTGPPAIVLALNSTNTNLNTGGFTGSTNTTGSGGLKESTGFTNSKTTLPVSSTLSQFIGASNFSSISNGIQVLISGMYRLKTNVHISAGTTRGNLCVGFQISDENFNSNNIVNPIASSFYIRRSGNHTESSGYTAGIYNLTANDTVKVISEREGNTGSMTLNRSNSYLEIVKINTSCAVKSHGNQTTFNLHSTSNSTIPMDGTLHEFNGSGNFTSITNGIKVNYSGIYKISFNMFILSNNSSNVRFSFIMAFQKNGNFFSPRSAEAGSFYIRNQNTQTMSSGYVSQYVDLAANDELTINCERESSTSSGYIGIYMWHLSNSTKYSSFMDIEKITDPVITCTANQTTQRLNKGSWSIIDFSPTHTSNEYNGTGFFTLQNGGIKVNSSGIYIISTNIALFNNSAARTNIFINFFKNSESIYGTACSNYIRDSSSHERSSSYLSRTVELDANDIIYVKSQREAAGNDNTSLLLSSERSILEMRKIS